MLIYVLKDAFRVFLENNPEKKIVIGIEMYRRERVSLLRAAEIAGMDIIGLIKKLFSGKPDIIITPKVFFYLYPLRLFAYLAEYREYNK